MFTPSKTARLLCRVSPRALIAGGMAALVISPSGEALAQSRNGSVTQGGANISHQGGNTTINQSTDRVIIEWDNFDIGVEETVEFVQPRNRSIALNRVESEVPTQIEGALKANGNVWVVNQSGIVFHESAQVDVGGLIATTSDIDDADFASGNFDFSKPGRDGASVVNRGNITVGEAGLAALVGPGTENDGMIQATMGTVVLGGNESLAVDFAGDGLIAFELGEEVSVSNSGSILAEGGQVLISAETATSLVNATVSLGGEIETASSGETGGLIDIDGGDGRVDVTGRLAATGAETNEAGGRVNIEAAGIWLQDGAEIDVSGQAGGGQAHIGGNARGGGTTRRAERTRVEAGASIAANATTRGDGGEVIVWADGATSFFGSLSAEGGALAGNGGFAEISGAQFLSFDGDISLIAPNGDDGVVLFDPRNVTIANSGDDPNGNILFDDPGLDLNGLDSTIDESDIENIAGGVVIEAENNITVAEEINSDEDLTLRAGNDIILEDDITVRNGTNDAVLTLTADADLISTQGNANLPSDDDGTIVFSQKNNGDDITLDADFVVIETGEAVELGQINALSLTVTARGQIDDTDGLGLNVGDFNATFAAGAFTAESADGTTRFDILLDNGLHDFNNSVDFTGANVVLRETDLITLGDINAETLVVASTGGLIRDTERRSHRAERNRKLHSR